ncbi:unnamed protein product [Phytophthora fragariaefolia]|uniref:Unnamed protein product n=1 Tax=Phytophthora fragariaefolia TaxID=1490495 RepID=A0A9W7DB10_9STRA|nr:unnamed protein product [Phytophthora fragariaefolia]
MVAEARHTSPAERQVEIPAEMTDAAVVMITVSAESLWPMQQSMTCTVVVSRANFVGAATRATRPAVLALTDSAATVVRTQTTTGIMWMLEQLVIGSLGTATRLPVVVTAEITAQLAEMTEASANAPTTEIAETAEMITVRGVPMIAENDAVTRLSDPAMVLVQHAEAAGTQHTSAIGDANSASRCMMRGAARCSSAWRSSPSSSAPPSTSQRYPLTYTTSTSREIYTRRPANTDWVGMYLAATVSRACS